MRPVNLLDASNLTGELRMIGRFLPVSKKTTRLRFRCIRFLALLSVLGITTTFTFNGGYSQTAGLVDGQLENRHQRWLPLPNGRFPSVLELEKQFRPPGEANSRSSPLDSKNRSEAAGNDNSAIDEKEIQQLQDIIKEFSDQLPSGMIPPDMGGISHEAIARAMQDPEVRRKAEQLMEQYARNGGELPEQVQNRFAPNPSGNNAPKNGSPQNRVQRAQPTDPSRPRNAPSPFPNQSAPQSVDENDSRTIEEKLFEQQQLDRPQQTRQQREREMAQSMEELLKQMGEVEAKHAAQKGRESPGNRMGSDGMRTSPDLGQSPSNNIKKQLDEKGFESTLRSIVEQARREAEESAKSSANNSTDAPSPNKELSSPNRPSPPRSMPPSSNSTAANPGMPNKTSAAPKPDTVSAAPRDPNSWGPWISKVLTDLNESVSKQSKQSPTTQPNSSERTAMAAPALGDVALPSPWVGLLGLALIGLLIYVFYGKRIREQVIAMRETQRVQSDLLRAPERIQNRADVVRAFHQLAYRIAAPVEEWWTHRMIARQACRNAPGVHSPMEIAVGVYEHARYLPVHLELTSDQLDSMRQALKDCEQESK